MNRASENNKEDIKTAAKEILGQNAWRCVNRGLMKSVYDFVIKGSRLKCSDYKIQTKAMYVSRTESHEQQFFVK